MGSDDLNEPGRQIGDEPDGIDPAQVLDQVQQAVDRLRRHLSWAAGVVDGDPCAESGGEDEDHGPP